MQQQQLKDPVTYKSLPPADSSSSSKAAEEMERSWTMNALETVLYICESFFYLESNLFLLNKHTFFQSLAPLLWSASPSLSTTAALPWSFKQIETQLQSWQRQRDEVKEQYQSSWRSIPQIDAFQQSKRPEVEAEAKKPRLNLEVITYASNHTEGLEALLFSSILSGVRLTVLGLDQPYVDYATKIETYNDYLVKHHRRAEAEAADFDRDNDNDVILLIDAYDVLLFPQIQQIEKVLYESRTPIVFCAEAGIYVEYAGKLSFVYLHSLSPFSIYLLL